MNKKICISVFYSDNENYIGHINTVKSFFKFITFDSIIIANTYSNEIFIHRKNQRNITIKNSNLNDEMEFSGYYYSLIEYYKTTLSSQSSNDIIFFINDTLFQHGKLRKIEKISLWEWLIKLKFNVGNKNSIDKKVIGFKHKSTLLTNTEINNGYFNTKFFIFNKLSIHEIESLFSINRIYVDIDNKGKYINNIFTSNNYSLFLKNWLNGDNGWYKSTPLTDDNKNFFINKSRSIIHEHLLSQQIKILNIKYECIVTKSLLSKIISFITRLHYQ